MTGTIPQATALGKFRASIPAEKDTGNSKPRSSRNRCMRFIEITYSGGPERYMYGSVCVGKNSGLLATTSVFVNFAPMADPRLSANGRRLRNISRASSYLRSCSKASRCSFRLL